MSATISRFPGGRPAAAGAERALEAAAGDAATLTRLIEFYRGFAALPFDRIGPESIDAISVALDEERYKDAMDLVDIVLERVKVAQEDFDTDEVDDDGFESPIPEAAQIWRFDGSAHSRGNLRSVPAWGETKLLPTRASLNSDLGADWAIRCGDLGLGGGEEAALELGLKGEVFLLLFSGSATVAMLDGEEVGSVDCVDGRACLRQIVYCRARYNHRPLTLVLRANGKAPVSGIWCQSSRFGLSDGDRSHDPDNQDVFFSREFHPVELATPKSGFCTHSKPVKEHRNYEHYESVRRRELARFDFAAGEFSSHESWSVDPWTNQTKVRGVRAAKSPSRAKKTGRQMRVHSGSLEFIVALNGVTWFAVTPAPPAGPSGEQETPMIGGRQVDFGRTPAWVDAMVAPGRASHDVLLLNPSYAHCAWTTPGSDARFLHLCFNDPKAIKPALMGDQGCPETFAVPLRRAEQ